MNSLHTFSSRQALTASLALVGKSDSVLLLEDAVFADYAQLLSSLPKGIGCYALRDDLLARGILQRLPSGIDTIGFDDFVRLCCEHDKVINW